MKPAVVAILAFMNSQPITWCEREIETKAHREQRLELPAEVISAHTGSSRWALIAIGYVESTWAWYVEDDCTWMPEDASGDCDGGLARTFWQLQQGACPALHQIPKGTDKAKEMRIGAECAARQFRSSYRACSGNLEKAFAHYGGAGCRATPTSIRKAKIYRRLQALGV